MSPSARVLFGRSALLLAVLVLQSCGASPTPAPQPPAAAPPPAVAAAPAAAPAPAPAVAAAPSVAITILHTNDHHGHAWAWQRRSEKVGSLAARAALVAQIRAEVARRGGHVLLVDGGDFNTGSYCSDELKAEPDLSAYRRMGYQAAAVGNHEFDQSYDVLRQQVAQAGFPLLSANVVLRASGQPALADVAEWTLGGVRVAAVGLTPGETATLSTHGKDPRLRFLDPAVAAAARVPELRARARVVVGLFHLDLAEIQKIAAQTPGLDVVVSGHDHQALAKPIQVGSTTIVQAGSDGRFLGRVDLEVPARGKVVVRQTRLYPIGGDLPEEPGVAASLAAFRARCGGDVLVGHLAAPGRRDELVAGPGTPSALANLVADALRGAARADVAFTNRGGIRTDLPVGPITRQMVHDVLPFADTLTVFTVTGAELLKLVDEMSRRPPAGQGVLYPSGLTIRFHGPGSFEVLRNGKLVKPRDRLTLAVSTFIAGGGDGYQTFATLRRSKVLPVSPKAALEAWLKTHDPTMPPCEARTQWDRPPGYAAPSPCGLVGKPARGPAPRAAHPAPAPARAPAPAP